MQHALCCYRKHEDATRTPTVTSSCLLRMRNTFGAHKVHTEDHIQVTFNQNGERTHALQSERSLTQIRGPLKVKIMLCALFFIKLNSSNVNKNKDKYFITSPKSSLTQNSIDLYQSCIISDNLRCCCLVKRVMFQHRGGQKIHMCQYITRIQVLQMHVAPLYLRMRV